MYGRILMALDGSATSQHALQEAIGLAKDQQAHLGLLHIIEDAYFRFSEGFPDPEPIAQAWQRTGQAILDEARALARQGGIEPEDLLRTTQGRSISTAILAEAERWHASLLVLGTHGRHGLERLLLGSVAEAVAHRAPVPLLLVHAS